MPDSKITTIELAYDGEALRSGSMDVRDLAPALLAVGELCEKSNLVLNGNRAQITVRVQADFKTGSFDVVLLLHQTCIEVAKEIFTHSEQISTVADLVEIIGFVGGTAAGTGISLFKLIKWLKGKKPNKTELLPNGDTRIFIDNSLHVEENHIDVSANVVSLFNNEDVRKAALGIVRPLERNGIDKLKLRSASPDVEIIEKEDYSAFMAVLDPDFEELILENEREAALTVVKPSFDENLRWTFSEGEARFGAIMEDQEFLRKLDNREISFTKGDVLVVKLFTKSYQIKNGLRTDNVVRKVLQVRPAPRQMILTPLN